MHVLYILIFDIALHLLRMRDRRAGRGRILAGVGSRAGVASLAVRDPHARCTADCTAVLRLGLGCSTRWL
jgi:hypothetical protein